MRLYGRFHGLFADDVVIYSESKEQVEGGWMHWSEQWWEG